LSVHVKCKVSDVESLGERSAAELREVAVNSPTVDIPNTGRRLPAARRDAVRNYYRILGAAREVLGEKGADASMEQIAARAGVGIGTVYRHFASKDSLIDELLQQSLDTVLTAAEAALDRSDGEGLEQLLRAIGRSLADGARYAHLLLQRQTDNDRSLRVRAAVAELTTRAVQTGTVRSDVTFSDIMALIWGMRGLIEATHQTEPDSWQRFLVVHLSGLRTNSER
jgi:AcrR family transcriptional regulator